MDDSKIFMFPDGGTRQTSSDVNSLLPLLMCNGSFGGGSWIWIIFLFFLYPLMRNGGLFGNMGQNCGGCLGPLANMVNNNDGRDLIMVQRNMNKSELKEKIRRMKMELQELEECLDKYEERDNRYDDDPQYRSRNPYDDEERYHEREEYGHRERGRYGRY